MASVRLQSAQGSDHDALILATHPQDAFAALALGSDVHIHDHDVTGRVADADPEVRVAHHLGVDPVSALVHHLIQGSCINSVYPYDRSAGGTVNLGRGLAGKVGTGRWQGSRIKGLSQSFSARGL
jgi:hypothetical protein